jgi:hypothetical protein
MKKTLWFFSVILVAGGALSHTKNMTTEEAQAHLADLQKQQTTKRAYMYEIGGAFV